MKQELQSIPKVAAFEENKHSFKSLDTNHNFALFYYQIRE